MSTNGEGDHAAQILQAQGRVAAQVGCTLDEALLLMRARAQSSDLSLAYAAAMILDSTIRFDE